MAKKTISAKKPAVAKKVVKKNTAPKKGAVKAAVKVKAKAPAKTAAKKPGGLKAQMIRELNMIIPTLDEDSLRFVLQQSGVLYRNMKSKQYIESYNKGLITDKSAPRPAPANKYSIDVKEGEDGRYFMIGVNRYWSFFAREEMKKLVRLCHAGHDVKDASSRLFNWLSRERGDVVKNTGIAGSSDPALATIYNYIIKTYTVKD